MPPPSPATPIRPRLAALAALATAPAFAAAIAPWLPIAHWTVDLPASFPVQAGGALLLGALALLALRHRWLAAIWALGALCAALAVVPGWLAAPAATAPGASQNVQHLTVLTVNLARGNHRRAAAALAEIRRADPDVLFLSEVTPDWLQTLAPALDDWPHREIRTDPGYFGVALCSRLPLPRVEVIALGYDWAPAVRAVVATPGGEVGILAVHTPRPGRGRRCDERDTALAAIAAAIAPLPPRRVVLGDFNATPWNRAFGAMLAATALHNASGNTFRPTWPMRLPWPLRVPIDHVLIGGPIAAQRIATGDGWGSDHAPLFAALWF